MKTLAFCLSTILLIASTALASDERLGLDPVLHGVWMVHGISSDAGETVEPMRPALPMAQASASRIKFADGNVVSILKVMVTKDKNGDPANAALLSNGKILFFSKSPGQTFVLIQVMDTDTNKEISRWLITVE